MSKFFCLAKFNEFFLNEKHLIKKSHIIIKKNSVYIKITDGTIKCTLVVSVPTYDKVNR